MNGNVKGFIGFLLGAIAGGVAAYIYQDKRLSKKFEEELKAYTEPKVEADTAEGEDTNDNTATDEPKGDDDDMKKTNIPQDALDAAKKMQEGAKKAKEDREQRGERERSKTNYSKLTRGYASSGKEESEGDDKDMTMSEKIIKNQPYYISKEEFMEMDMKDGYRGVDLFYNADTDTIAAARANVTIFFDFMVKQGFGEIECADEKVWKLCAGCRNHPAFIKYVMNTRPPKGQIPMQNLTLCCFEKCAFCDTLNTTHRMGGCSYENPLSHPHPVPAFDAFPRLLLLRLRTEGGKKRPPGDHRGTGGRLRKLRQ